MGISIGDLERVAALTWRAPDEDRLGDWLLRAAAGFTGRANSALAVGDPGRPLAAAATAVCRWYGDRGLPAMIAVPYPAGRPSAVPLDRQLAAWGWTVRSGPATVMTAPAAAVARRGDTLDLAIDVAPEPDEAWLARYHYRGQPRLPAAARDVLLSGGWQAFASVRAGGETIGIGRVAAGGGWAGLTAVEVDPRYRRQGVALALTARLAGLAARCAAPRLYLQVEDGNTAARSLYHRAGFAVHHGYHYRIAPGQAAG